MLNIEIASIMNGNEFEAAGIKVFENTAEEIRDVSIEMMDRLEGKWVEKSSDESLQKFFWQRFDDMHKSFIKKNGRKVHGTLKGKIGANFLRKNFKKND